MFLNKTPLVSIITPSYNQGDFIEYTLQSVKNQNYPKIEHIVVDGDSTDDTTDILENYQPKYNLKWISEPDEGQSDAINKGFEMASGEVIGWLNSDDLYFTKDVLKYVVSQFKRRSEISIMYGDVCHIDSVNRIKRIDYIPEFSYNKLLKSNFICQPAVLFRKKVVKSNQLKKDLKYAMDYEYWLRLGKKYNWAKLDKIIAADRRYSQTKSAKGGKEREKESEKLNENYGARKFSGLNLGFFDLFKKYLKELEYILSLNDKNLTIQFKIPSKKILILNKILMNLERLR